MTVGRILRKVKKEEGYKKDIKRKKDKKIIKELEIKVKKKNGNIERK